MGVATVPQCTIAVSCTCSFLGVIPFILNREKEKKKVKKIYLNYVEWFSLKQNWAWFAPKTSDVSWNFSLESNTNYE